MDKLTGTEMTNDPSLLEEVDQDNSSQPSDENEEVDQHVHSEPAGEDVVRRGHHKRKLTEKVRENKLKELTTTFWKLHDKYASETNEAEIRLSGYCTQETLTKMKLCLVQGFSTD